MPKASMRSITHNNNALVRPYSRTTQSSSLTIQKKTLPAILDSILQALCLQGRGLWADAYYSMHRTQCASLKFRRL
ncbi:unnamed protein product [Cyberlindnera jadinii]|uniref:Uncharacterized protein n=1 Tax=Cyberlindnera jadinii (strain ATCC 18201 / CBS 1600 / BCRC 20928 / JCM 3617 / NBRC 0987 / NRRL Y-1542) TaxID=983966 RepID=A0A0H5BYH9_CYBJN|nr:unnamed protein product [Cyberlindnera jadinii]